MPDSDKAAPEPGDRRAAGQPPPPDAPTRILYLAANPTDVRLRIDEEVRRIQDKLQLARLRDQFEFAIRMAVRSDDLIQSLLDFRPHIVHFSGHGAQDGSLMLADDQGTALPVAPAALEALFEVVPDQVRCVLLNACYSESQAQAIVRHIPFVIGMRQEITDKAALAFSVGFYQALGGGRTIEEAYKLGVVQIRFQVPQEHLVPVLMRQAGG